MKSSYLSIALLTTLSSLSFGQPSGPMSFKNTDGSVLTISSPNLGNPNPQTVSGTYLDNSGLGGCTKGTTYSNLSVKVTGGPSSAVSFESELCTGVHLKLAGTIPMPTPPSPTPPPPGSLPPIPVPSIDAMLSVTSSLQSTFTAQP